MQNKRIIVSNRVARYQKRDGAIVCNNTGYSAVFTFDAEWEAHEVKFARFAAAGIITDVEFKGNTCPIPPAKGAEVMHVGVFTGDPNNLTEEDFWTTTAAQIPCDKSIKCISGSTASSTESPSAGAHAKVIRNTVYDVSRYTSIEVAVQPNLQNKVAYANGEITADQGYDGLGKVTVAIPDTDIKLQEKVTNENGSVTPDEGYHGLSKVDVDVQPTLQTKKALKNGDVTPDKGYDGLSKVEVDVQPKLQPKRAYGNGKVTPDQGFDGLSEVDVAIPDAQINLQEKTAAVNGDVTPDQGYHGLSKVKVNVTPLLQEKNVYGNGEVTPDQNYDGLSRVNVSVTPRLQTKTAKANGDVTPDQGYDGLRKVTVEVEGGSDVKLQEKDDISENGQYFPEEGYNGFSRVTVNVQPLLQEKPAYANGTVTPDPGFYGLSTVKVQVPEKSVKLQIKNNVTENGTVTADKGFDGLSSVTVNVQPKLGSMSAKGTEEKTYKASDYQLDGFDEFTVYEPSRRLQEKEVETSTDIVVEPDHYLGYDALSKVTVTVSKNVKLQEKPAYANGTVTPDPGYDGLSKVVVAVPDKEPNLYEPGAVTPTKDSQIVTVPSGYDGLDAVVVNPIPAEYVIPTKEGYVNEYGPMDVTEYKHIIFVPASAEYAILELFEVDGVKGVHQYGLSWEAHSVTDLNNINKFQVITPQSVGDSVFFKDVKCAIIKSEEPYSENLKEHTITYKDKYSILKNWSKDDPIAYDDAVHITEPIWNAKGSYFPKPGLDWDSLTPIDPGADYPNYPPNYPERYNYYTELACAGWPWSFADTIFIWKYVCQPQGIATPLDEWKFTSHGDEGYIKVTSLEDMAKPTGRKTYKLYYDGNWVKMSDIDNGDGYNFGFDLKTE